MAVISYLDMNPRTKAALVSLDFWKAFDRVLVTFLEKVMKAMGFPKKFLNWVTMCHKGATTRFFIKEDDKNSKCGLFSEAGGPFGLSIVPYIHRAITAND